MPETCPECGRLFLSFRALSCHLDRYAADIDTRARAWQHASVRSAVCSHRRDHSEAYVANALAVLEHARKKAREHDEQDAVRVEAARTRTLTPGEPQLPPPLAMCSPYVGDLGDVLNLFGNRRTLRFFLRHEQLVRALARAHTLPRVLRRRVRCAAACAAPPRALRSCKPLSRRLVSSHRARRSRTRRP
jgi:hypothetical protein